MASKKQFSFIIPHKNIPKLLERCINSIPHRDDLEIIIVDDNSSPDIVDFSHFPGKDRENTTVIFDKSGKYAGHARNLGLESAQGKWILFADADDFFNYCINDILNEYENDDSDVIYFKANSVDTDDYSASDRANERLNLYIDHFQEDPEKYSNLLKYRCGEPWAKMIKKRLIDQNNILFEESIINNDHRFSYILGYHTKKIKIDKRALYCVTTRSGSVSRNTTDNAILTRIRVFGEAELFFRSHNIPKYVYWDWHYKLLLNLYYSNKPLFKKSCDILRNAGFTDDDLNEGMLKNDLAYRNYIEKYYKVFLRYINRKKLSAGKKYI